MIDIEVRRAQSVDIPRLVAFNQAMAKETESLVLDEATLTAGVKQLFQHPEYGFYLVACRGTEVIGCLMVTTEWSDWRNGLFWWIQSVYVHPEHRRLGVYRELYATVKLLAAARQEVIGFRLYVDNENKRAQSTYERQGMTHTNYILFEELKEKDE